MFELFANDAAELGLVATEQSDVRWHLEFEGRKLIDYWPTQGLYVRWDQPALNFEPGTPADVLRIAQAMISVERSRQPQQLSAELIAPPMITRMDLFAAHALGGLLARHGETISHETLAILAYDVAEALNDRFREQQEPSSSLQACVSCGSPTLQGKCQLCTIREMPTP